MSVSEVRSGRTGEGRGRVVAFGLFAFVLATLFSILLAEFAVRTLWTHRVRTPFALDDPRFLYRNEPGLSGYHTAPGEFAYHFSINSRGFRGEEIAGQSEPGVLRVLSVGDSFTWGTGVEDEQTYPAQLARILSGDLDGRPVEVINTGVMSWGISQYYRWTLEEGLKLDPDVIVIAMFHDDWMQALLGLVTEAPDGSLQTEDLVFTHLRTERAFVGSVPGFRWLMTNSQLFNWMRDSMRSQVTWPPSTNAFAKADGTSSGPEQEQARKRKERDRKKQAYRLTEKMLVEIAEATAARDIPVVLAWIPDRKSIRALLLGEGVPYFPDDDATKLALQETLEPHGIAVVDPREDLVEELKSTGMDLYELYFRRDGHFYPRGYEILAEVVAPAVLEALDRDSGR